MALPGIELRSHRCHGRRPGRRDFHHNWRWHSARNDDLGSGFHMLSDRQRSRKASHRPRHAQHRPRSDPFIVMWPLLCAGAAFEGQQQQWQLQLQRWPWQQGNPEVPRCTDMKNQTLQLRSSSSNQGSLSHHTTDTTVMVVVMPVTFPECCRSLGLIMSFWGLLLQESEHIKYQTAHG